MCGQGVGKQRANGREELGKQWMSSWQAVGDLWACSGRPVGMQWVKKHFNALKLAIFCECIMLSFADMYFTLRNFGKFERILFHPFVPTWLSCVWGQVCITPE